MTAKNSLKEKDRSKKESLIERKITTIVSLIKTRATMGTMEVIKVIVVNIHLKVVITMDSRKEIVSKKGQEVIIGIIAAVVKNLKVVKRDKTDLYNKD